ncbi:MAG: hypothetical protein ACM3ML_36405 [Micromonosporaceae bacterium]
MPVVALGTWIVTALGGLFLLAVWLIEYDPEFQSAAPTRLPVPVLTAHALLAVTGLIIWGLYLIADSERLAELAAAVLLLVAVLGLTMGARWVGVYRAHPARARAGAGAVQAAIPPERNFPLPVVIGHGIFAVTTLILVLLTVL